MLLPLKVRFTRKVIRPLNWAKAMRELTLKFARDLHPQCTVEGSVVWTIAKDTAGNIAAPMVPRAVGPSTPDQGDDAMSVSDETIIADDSYIKELPDYFANDSPYNDPEGRRWQHNGPPVIASEMVAALTPRVDLDLMIHHDLRQEPTARQNGLVRTCVIGTRLSVRVIQLKSDS